MIKKTLVYILLLSLFSQPILANGLLVLMSVNDISSINPVTEQLVNNDMPCHDEALVEHQLKIIDLDSKNLSSAETPTIKQHHCKKSCHCSTILFSAVLLNSIESHTFSGHSEFTESFLSAHPIKIPFSLLRPPKKST